MHIYYYHKVGEATETIPATVVWKGNGSWLIHGNFPDGDNYVWVDPKDCVIQEDKP